MGSGDHRAVIRIRNANRDQTSFLVRNRNYLSNIEGFDSTGCLELFLWPKLSADTIWIEPHCVVRSRRPLRLSKAFLRRRQIESAPKIPRLAISFDIVAQADVDLEELGHSLTHFGTGGGFGVWPKGRRIKGSVYAEKHLADARERLLRAALLIRECDSIQSFKVSEIAESEI